MDQIFSTHYQSYFSFESFKEAFENFYLPYCEEQEENPNLEQDDFNSLDISDFEDELIDEIFIKSEDYGFDIEENKSIEEYI